MSLVSSISSAARFDVELSPLPLVITELAALALVIAGASGSSSLNGCEDGTLVGVWSPLVADDSMSSIYDLFFFLRLTQQTATTMTMIRPGRTPATKGMKFILPLDSSSDFYSSVTPCWRLFAWSLPDSSAPDDPDGELLEFEEGSEEVHLKFEPYLAFCASRHCLSNLMILIESI